MLTLAIILVSLFVLIVAAYVDLKTLEVPDWLNYAGIAAGIGIHLIYSAQQWSYWPAASSAIGLAVAFAFACFMFYTGQWGGGDAKLLMAMGALIGFEMDKFAFGTSFLINLVFVGGAWMLFYTIILALANKKRFWKTFRALGHHKAYARLRLSSTLTTALFVIGALFLAEFRLELLGLALLCYSLSFLTLFIKSIELSALHKWVTPDKLTEGDWLVHAIQIGKTRLDPPRLGLEKKELAQLQKWQSQKKIGKVLVKYGVPFTPAFLLSFLLTLGFGNVILEAFVRLV